MSIRWRLTIWFSFIFLVILVISGVVLNTLLQRYLYLDVDNNLKLNSARVHGTLHTNLNDPLDFNVIHSSLPPINEFSSPGIYIQLIDREGNIIIKSDNLANQSLPVNPQLIQNGINGDTDIQTLSAVDDVNVRVMVSPLFTTGQVYILEVAQSLKPVEDALRQFRVALIGSALLALLLTGILGFMLIRRTLRPVDVITGTAEKIEESSNLDRRVGYSGPADEIGRLAGTFDHMIERLEKSFSSQKRFVADASHELRTPLTVMQGNLDLLKRGLSEEDRQESLKAIEYETRRLTKIAGDLLLLAEVESGEIIKQEAVSLKALVIEEVQRAGVLAGKRRIVTGRLEDITVTGNSDKLNQVISNLVDNAIKYSPDEALITLEVFRDEGWATLKISDTGFGIAPEDIPHLFERFYRVDTTRSRSRGGTGLGLAIVKNIVEQHRGTVTVSSEPGKGSAFTVRLKL